jgi:hypothetical protein
MLVNRAQNRSHEGASEHAGRATATGDEGDEAGGEEMD